MCERVAAVKLYENYSAASVNERARDSAPHKGMAGKMRPCSMLRFVIGDENEDFVLADIRED